MANCMDDLEFNRDNGRTAPSYNSKTPENTSAAGILHHIIMGGVRAIYNSLAGLCQLFASMSS